MPPASPPRPKENEDEPKKKKLPERSDSNKKQARKTLLIFLRIQKRARRVPVVRNTSQVTRVIKD